MKVSETLSSVDRQLLSVASRSERQRPGCSMTAGGSPITIDPAGVRREVVDLPLHALAVHRGHRRLVVDELAVVVGEAAPVGLRPEQHDVGLQLLHLLTRPVLERLAVGARPAVHHPRRHVGGRAALADQEVGRVAVPLGQLVERRHPLPRVRVADQHQRLVAVGVAARAERPVVVDLEVLALAEVGDVGAEVEQRRLEVGRDLVAVLAALTDACTSATTGSWLNRASGPSGLLPERSEAVIGGPPPLSSLLDRPRWPPASIGRVRTTTAG